MLFTSERRGTRFAFVFFGGKDKLIIYLYRDIIIFLLYREMDRIPKWFSSRSRKVAPSATVAPSGKVATQSVYRQIMRTMSRSGKVAPDEGTVIKQQQKKEIGMPIVEEEPFSPFEVRISSSRNQMSNNSPSRYQMPKQSEISRMRETLRFLDKNSHTIPKPIIDKHPTILNHTLLIELLNGKQFDLSGITEINLNRSDDDLHHIFKFKIKIIQLLTFTLHTSDKIDTIVIDYIDYLIPVLLVLKSYPQKLQTIKKLILKSKCGTPKPITDEVIFDLLNMIEEMNALEELEFSNFEMDVSKFKDGFTLMDFFRRIVAMLKKLKHITFDCNSFTDSETEKKYDSFRHKYFSRDGIPRDNLKRIDILIEWMIQNPEQNIDSSGAYKAYIYSIFWNNYSTQKEKAERTQIPTDYNERKLFFQERRINLPKISDVEFKEFLNDKEAVKVWLKWLILNKAEYIEYRETKIEGDIVERLRIVIEYFKYNKDSIIRFFNENPSLQEVIISEFSKIWQIYQYQPIRIDEHYNRIIKDIITNKLVKSRGGHKAPKKPPKQPKVSLKAPKKPPKQPKVALKEPKKPSKPSKVALKEPKKPSKQPKVALKEPKKPPKPSKVALKEPKKPSKQPNVALKAPTVARKTNKNK
jgi:hypothetical protein